MTSLDTVLDAKHLLAGMFSVGIEDIDLKYFATNPPTTPADDTLMGDMARNDVVLLTNYTSSTRLVEKVNEVATLQADIKERNGIIPWDNGVSITRSFISLTSHNLVVFRQPPPSAEENEGQGADGRVGHDELRGEIDRLTVEIDTLTVELKNKKAELSKVKKAYREADITVKLRTLGAETVDVETQASKTVNQFRSDIQFAGLPRNPAGARLIIGLDILDNKKRLYTYGVENGTVIDVVFAGFANPPVGGESSSDESAVEEDAVAEDAPVAPLAVNPTLVSVALNEHPDFQKRLIIVVPRLNDAVEISFWFGNQTKGDQLFEMLADYLDVPQQDFRLMWQGTNSRVEQFDTLSSYFGNGDRLQMHFPVRGGVITHHLKKDDAMQKLRDRVTGKIIDKFKKDYKHLDGDDTGKTPIVLLTYLQEFANELNKLRVLRAENIPVIKLGLKKLSNSQLSSLLEITKVSGRNGSNEDRLILALGVLYPQMIALDHGMVSLKEGKKDAMTNLLGIFVDEYGSYLEGQGTSTLNIQSFRNDVLSEMNNRTDAVSQEQANSCIIS
eukprot:Skav207143  [mRNA]  locus=scaffold4102:2555:4228:- [translate_table: standard]